MEDINKFLYCDKCKEFPDEVLDVLSNTVETRKWDGECYELVETNYGESKSICAKCNTELIEK